MNDDGRVFEKYRTDLLRYATALVGPSDAEDVVMTVVARAVRRRRLSELENPRGYLLRGVLNEARGHARRSRPISLDGDLPAERLDGMSEILDVLMTLPIRQRSAIYLHYWERAPIAEIADTMGIGPGTVKRYLHLARRRLREVL